jgi:hypothetical protein
MSERAQRITEERELCQVHGFDRVVYDVTLGAWLCLGEGDHWPRASTELPSEMAADVERLLGGAQ